MSEDQLGGIRGSDPDDLDEQIQTLLNAAHACPPGRVARIKLASDPQAVFYRPT